MSSYTFQYAYFVRAPARKIYAHLAEPTNYIGLSPLLISLTDVEWGENTRGERVTTYKSVELFRLLGFIKYHNPLDVVMTLTIPNQQIISDVQTGKNVRVLFTFDLKSQEDGTTVTETISATSPPLLRSFVVNQAKAVQQNRARVLKSRMES